LLEQTYVGSPPPPRAPLLHRHALNAGWDEKLLALELKELMEADIDVDVGHRLLDRGDRPACQKLTPQEPCDPADDRLPDPNNAQATCGG
jgi:hypothetical protein